MFFSLLKKQRYVHLNTVLLRKSHILHNHSELKKLVKNSAVCPVLKSNAYGHGLKEMATVFDTLNAPFLIVDSLYEAYELYKVGVKTPVLILGYTHPENFSVKKLPFHFTVYDYPTALALAEFQPGCSVHIFVDTGMNREGVPLDELPAFLQQISKLDIAVVGLTSHLADADNPSSLKFSMKQLENYKKAYQIMSEHGVSPQWRHLSASAGVAKLQSDVLNMYRAGLASYGISPLSTSDKADSQWNLKPVMQVITHVAQLKTISRGAKVGYNGTFVAKKKMKIAILPIGYYDGVDRRLSNKGVCRVDGVECAILGRVSMNITIIDVSHLPSLAVGAEVEIFSDDPQAPNSFVNSAEVAETIPYDLLVKITSSMHREIV